MTKKEVVLKVKNLKKTFKEVKAVRGVSFEVKRGEIFGLLGPNGAGKTTTLEMIEGLREVDSGEVFVCGIDSCKKPEEVKNVIGVQLQSSSFFDKLTLVELLKFFGELYEVEVDPMKLLAEVELTEKKKSYVKTLSGGQKQRFSIASALVNNPKVLFLDEPTTGLDPQARRHLWELIKGIQKKGITIIITTHYMDEAEILCDRVAIMDEGRIISIDTPNKLIDNLIKKGFKKERTEKLANLEDVFIDLTGHELRE